ncbi:tyrosine--tRNA ligase [Candidatus Woesearchaeota archaeon]|nr:tyrosine--tRNA ligase [Candidatus Woesearchaeota archaeon]
MDLKNVEFVWASDLLDNKDYWKTVMQVARLNTLKRIIRTVEIMGRKESDTLYGSQMLYPCMQAADIFHLKADICQLGMDQRKVNVLAREIGEKLGYWKPVVVSHHMLMGLGQPPKEDSPDRVMELKMSKSKPDTAIFMGDSEEDINRKIRNAYCPAKIVQENPIMEYCKYLIFEQFKVLEIKRPEKFGGDVVIETYHELESLYAKGELHPADLKSSVSEYINKMVEPVRQGLHKNSKIAELRKKIKGLEVTR